MGSVVSSPPLWGRGGAPAENRFQCFSSVTENDKMLLVEMFVVNWRSVRRRLLMEHDRSPSRGDRPIWMHPRTNKLAKRCGCQHRCPVHTTANGRVIGVGGGRVAPLQPLPEIFENLNAKCCFIGSEYRLQKGANSPSK